MGDISISTAKFRVRPSLAKVGPSRLRCVGSMESDRKKVARMKTARKQERKKIERYARIKM